LIQSRYLFNELYVLLFAQRSIWRNHSFVINAKFSHLLRICSAT